MMQAVNTERKLVGRDALRDGAKAMGVHLTEEMLDAFLLYNRLLLEWNQKLNLTALTAPEDVLHKHFLDSLALGRAPDSHEIKSVADIGSGAGFPGIPLKIAHPDWEITLVDALGKRVRFLEDVISELELKGITAVHARAEEIGRDAVHRGRYDCCVTRAVSALPVIAEYGLPLLRTGGLFAAYKGRQYHEELATSGAALEELGGALRGVFPYQIGPPEDAAERALILVKKIGATPEKYPRRPGKPEKNPL